MREELSTRKYELINTETILEHLDQIEEEMDELREKADEYDKLPDNESIDLGVDRINFHFEENNMIIRSRFNDMMKQLNPIAYTEPTLR